MRAVDTNLVVRLLTRDDPDQVRRAEDFIGQGAWMSHLVLLETVWVLESVFSLDPTKLARAVELLLHHERLVIQEPHVVAAALEKFQASKVDFSDCLILEAARKAGHLPLGSFDRALARLDGVVVPGSASSL